MSEFIESVLPSVVAALVGALAAIVGSRALGREERAYFKRKEEREQQEIRARAGHRAMLALESQRCLTQTLHGRISGEPNFMKWQALRVNRNSVPSVTLSELDFLVTGAKNQNILPALISQQQNFDQLIDTLEHFADLRRQLEEAELTASSLSGMFKRHIECVAKSLRETFDNILSKYAETQALLQGGLREVVSDFTPVFKV